MRQLFALSAAVAVATTAWAQTAPSDMVLIQGGTFHNIKSNYFAKSMVKDSLIGRMVGVKNFYIGKYEVTQKEWTEVMGSNPSQFKGDTLPVETVSWYDCIEYCNRRSAKEGFQPYYTLDKGIKDANNGNEIDTLKWTVTTHPGANGYRLPTEAEWEYAADGGQASKNFTYSGGDDIEKVAWYWANAGDKPLPGLWSWPNIERNHDKTQPVGGKEPNELGLYDMSGNVREWCWNWYSDTPSNGTEPAASAGGRVWRGGGWMGGDFCCASTFRGGFEASGKGPDQGLRVCRDK